MGPLKMTEMNGATLRSMSDIRSLYILPGDPLAEEVLIPGFQKAGQVDCMAGFFSSEALASLSPGLATFINNSALLHESYLGYHGRMLFFVQLIFSTRYDWGLPRWIIRLRMAQPKRLSTCWLAQLRAFSLSPMRCL